MLRLPNHLHVFVDVLAILDTGSSTASCPVPSLRKNKICRVHAQASSTAVGIVGLHMLERILLICPAHSKRRSVLQEAYGTLGLPSKRHKDRLFQDRNLGPVLQGFVGYLDLTGLSSNL
ncbi:hypothetical protein HPB50_013581 [Hyalomma asiaticum]|uniref:Uncharacterized protein n=1 Tax=Hyalomma asiaticum TaxID=266040 RepID=A0ACB7TC79_HYAAI|nr:hypothetical protein HPB50_013581 [Hyalomma asiaticum]